MAAHLLTGLRLLAVVPSALAFADPSGWGPVWPAGLVSLAIVTDRYDGRVARARGSASPAGQVFDHTTDFLFVTASLVGAAVAGAVPIVLPMLIVVAFAQYVVDSFLLYRQKELRMSWLGKWNGILYFVPLVGIALSRLPVPSGVESTFLFLSLLASWLLVFSTVASIVDRGVAATRA